MRDRSADGWDYRAERYQHVNAPPVSQSPVLHHDMDLPDAWWHDLHRALDHLAFVDTSRQAARERYIPTMSRSGRTVPRVAASARSGGIPYRPACTICCST
ncbi:hypothetical protein [Streptomyces noursei]|uniref:hypothetical protein n=1 Tax=Streptomyces noursei TaxID=1971 RepID=UPI0030F2868A